MVRVTVTHRLGVTAAQWLEWRWLTNQRLPLSVYMRTRPIIHLRAQPINHSVLIGLTGCRCKQTGQSQHPNRIGCFNAGQGETCWMRRIHTHSQGQTRRSATKAWILCPQKGNWLTNVTKTLTFVFSLGGELSKHSGELNWLAVLGSWVRNLHLLPSLNDRVVPRRSSRRGAYALGLWRGTSRPFNTP